jgi:LmbE family N-acetylglucosaminyl deacetylase
MKEKQLYWRKLLFLMLGLLVVCLLVVLPIVITYVNKNLAQPVTYATLQAEIDRPEISIYYIPHQDDDAIAFSLSIAHDLANNVPIQVHLISDGANHDLQQYMASGSHYCKWHNTNHSFPLDDQDISRIRTQEFLASMTALNVPPDKIHLMDLHDYQTPAAWTADLYNQLKESVKEQILTNHAQYPNALHHCSSGYFDFDGPRNPVHLACWDAAIEITNASIIHADRFAFYRTYVFYQPPPNRWAEMTMNLSQYLPQHRLSVQAYQAYDPSNGQYALGMHSVPILMNNSIIDGIIFLDFLNNTVQSPTNVTVL